MVFSIALFAASGSTWMNSNDPRTPVRLSWKGPWHIRKGG